MDGDSVTMDMRMSRGFVTSPTKENHDQLDMAMSMDVGEVARVGMSMYLERGPDLAISGLGQAATLSELQESASGSMVPVPRFWQELDFNFVPGTPGPAGSASPPFIPTAPSDGSSAVYVETVFDTELTMGAEDLASFNRADFMESVASAAGMAVEDVVVVGIVINVTVEYAFDDTVTVGQATTAVADANGVEENQVSVQVVPAGRRLSGGGLGFGLGDGRRRLADVNYEVVITLEDESQAVEVMASSIDTAVLATSLRRVAPDAPPPTVTEQPVAVVSVQTALRSSDGSAPAAPSNALLTEAIASDMNIDVQAVSTVVSQTTTSCSEGACASEDTTVTAVGGRSFASSDAIGNKHRQRFATLMSLAVGTFAICAA